jgi:hypothetical protein
MVVQQKHSSACIQRPNETEPERKHGLFDIPALINVAEHLEGFTVKWTIDEKESILHVPDDPHPEEPSASRLLTGKRDRRDHKHHLGRLVRSKALKSSLCHLAESTIAPRCSKEGQAEARPKQQPPHPSNNKEKETEVAVSKRDSSDADLMKPIFF